MQKPSLPSSPHPLACRLGRLLLAGSLALIGACVQAQGLPGRVGYLSLIEGVVQTGAINRPDAQMAAYNQPLTRGERLLPAPGARLEMNTGASSWRMEGPGQLDISQLDDQTAQMQLRQGRLELRVRQLMAGERIEIDTPNLAVLVQQPGDYRLDVSLEQGNTRVSVSQGSLVAYAENGSSLGLPQGLQWTFAGRMLAQPQPPLTLRPDGFDLWTTQRNQLEDQSQAARYLPREVIGYQQLDGWGEWRTDPTWGTVWVPQITIADWAPYRYGRWQWIEPWGWTWVDDAPWGFAPFHYGRWVQSGPHWCWVPDRYEHNRRPSYAPALVGFLGTPQAGSRPQVRQPDVGWVPLAPGEPWRAPGNPRPGQGSGLPSAISFLNQQRPEAITHQAQPGATLWGQLNNGQRPTPLPRPQIQQVPDRPGSSGPTPGSAPREGERRPNMSPVPSWTPQGEASPAQALGRPGVINQVGPAAGNTPRAELERQQQQQQMLREQQQREQAQRQQQQAQQQQMQIQLQQQAEAERQRQAQQQMQQQQHQQQLQQQQMQQQLQREQMQREQMQREQQFQQQQQQQHEQQLREQQQMREQLQRQQQQQQFQSGQRPSIQREVQGGGHEAQGRPGAGSSRPGGNAIEQLRGGERSEVRGNTQ